MYTNQFVKCIVIKLLVLVTVNTIKLLAPSYLTKPNCERHGKEDVYKRQVQRVYKAKILKNAKLKRN